MSEPDSTPSSRSLSKAPHANAEARSPSDDARSTDIPASSEVVNGSERPDDQTVISGGPPLARHVDPLGLHSLDDIQAFEGQMLGHFRIERFVGGGGMGAVYRALDTRLNRPVAVKILSAEPYSDADVERRFKNEAQSAARLDHENIARVYYFGVERGVHFIAFEFIDGINVRDLVVQRGPLPLAEAVSYTLQVADALAHASRRDVVHRDIKPSNVLVTSEGRAKLVDMGLARLHQVECSGEDLTASGVTLGTFDYISPEQARDPRNADIR
ncbi:MAG: serine/threonine-protein kinase, partial [Pirellulales bacterium]